MSKKPLSDLIKLAEGGADLDLGRTDRPMQSLIVLVKAARVAGTRVTITSNRTTKDLLRLVEASGGSLVIRLEDYSK